ncbi:hypothetical protein KIL84_017606 [Mauremys mutica]|uniref:Uncharacterized protein n=1 Tax=Mauremys mutica TaxID=74926 RepID=A0A9D3X574_9SAUR|nr:hypothetical protein KIL84_017606 [Mauremys mutica]
MSHHSFWLKKSIVVGAAGVNLPELGISILFCILEALSVSQVISIYPADRRKCEFVSCSIYLFLTTIYLAKANKIMVGEGIGEAQSSILASVEYMASRLKIF